ncbi:PAS and ANTAR domain-containing protein [Nocardia inohanensis]|uniref:PAS and ANTAR domain-containing protein n=1 Tax=Nocardia inohanensis TaxID=209246 RepID=UPI0009FC0BF4|nr:PAS and ANTAR domain-containing protein [Nocardia inohanensis]
MSIHPDRIDPKPPGTDGAAPAQPRPVDHRGDREFLTPGDGLVPHLVSFIGSNPESVGSFRFWFADQRWEWSDQVAILHGYSPGAVQPTTELLLSHKHPEDRAYVADTLAAAVQEGEPFCSRHRIIDTRGEAHHVLVLADRLHDNTGATVGTLGYYIDLTDDMTQERRAVLDREMPELVAARASIEQAKGVLMFMYSITADQAFDVLRWRSQETNTKLRVLAEKLLAGIRNLEGGSPRQRSRFDHLLLTVHEHPDPPATNGHRTR